MSEINANVTLVGFAKALLQMNLTPAQLRTDIYNYFEQKARMLRIPLIGLFELTPLCNFSCKMCYVHLTTDQISPSELLSVKDWIGIIDQAYKAGMRQAKLSGGECLTYNGFDEIFLFLEEKNIRTSVATNGYLVSKDRIDFFLKHRPSSIQVSLYGGSEESYEKVTGIRCFKTVYDNLVKMKDAKLPVSIAITPNRQVLNSIDELFDVAESLKIPYYINSLLIPPRANTERQFCDLSNKDYLTIFKRWNEVKGNNLVPISPEELPIQNKEGSKRKGIQCGAGRSSFTVLYDGKMCPCVSLEEIKVDILKTSFKDAWDKVVLEADNYIIPQECGECTYRSRCLICVAAHKNSVNSGHCNTSVCELTKAYIKEGILPPPD